jgi:5'-deoxynucleotidase YfbR-like HD superfamily hydrolase
MAKTSGSKPKTPRAWQRMLSGRRLDLLDPSPLDIELQDIAHGLARVMRWNGQTKGPQGFSVAQHSLLVERLCVHWRPGWPASYRMAALLHDAPEYVIGDLISPFKAAIGADYKALENKLLAAIHVRFGLPPTLPAAISQTIKRADIGAAYIEAIQLAGFDEPEAKRIFGPPRDLPEVRLKGLEPDDAAQKFVALMQKHMRENAKQTGSKSR